jgi:hypothetical protein
MNADVPLFIFLILKRVIVEEKILRIAGIEGVKTLFNGRVRT